MGTIRVYALIIGEVLPKSNLTIQGVTIKKMSLAEQKRRKFKPLSFGPLDKFSTDYKSYVANKNNQFDVRFIKTSYVMFVDVNANDPDSAINYAYTKFEEVIGALNIKSVTEHTFGNGRVVSYYYPFEYQIAKLYKIDGDAEIELVIEPIFNGASYSKLNFPRKYTDDETDFILDVENYVQLTNNYRSLKQAVEYLSYADRCLNFRFPMEMAVINLCKAIETLLNSFNFKKKLSFKKKLNQCNNIFQLTSEEVIEINKLWDERNQNDVAHAAEKYLYAMTFQNSLPVTKNKLLVVHNQPAIVAKMVKKYADFLNSLVHVKINKYQRKEDRVAELVHVINRGHYEYDSNERNLKKLIPEVKKRISLDLNIPYRKIKTYSHHDKVNLVFIINGRFSRRTKKSSYIIFGR